MRKFIFLFVFILTVSIPAYSQTITQTYVDRCTGEIFRFNIQSQGFTTVMFYNKARTFTALDVSSGVFKSWLEETYNWWRNINPCSINQSTVTATTQTTQQIASAAINIAPPPAPPSSSASSNTSESSPESSNESSSESESSDSQEEEEEKKEEKKKSTNPPIVSANIAAMQSLTGTYDIAASFGISKSSLLGDRSYGLNTMVWSNMSQFMLSGSYTKAQPLSNGDPNILHSTSVTALKMFSTYSVVVNHGKVFLGRDGSIFGMSLTLSSTSTETLNYDRELLSSFSSLFFYTKSRKFQRTTISPMIAFATQILSYDHSINSYDFPHSSLCVVGLNLNYQLTKRFAANIGANTATDLKFTIPTAVNYTIGSRLLF
jgi:hypothetical protein